MEYTVVLFKFYYYNLGYGFINYYVGSSDILLSILSFLAYGIIGIYYYCYYYDWLMESGNYILLLILLILLFLAYYNYS